MESETLNLILRNKRRLISCIGDDFYDEETKQKFRNQLLEIEAELKNIENNHLVII